jgi:hypothetical protein
LVSFTRTRAVTLVEVPSCSSVSFVPPPVIQAMVERRLLVVCVLCVHICVLCVCVCVCVLVRVCEKERVEKELCLFCMCDYVCGK